MSATTARYVPVDDTDDDETRRVKQAQNNALFLERVARTDADRRYAAWQRSIADNMAAAQEHRQRAARTQPPEPPVGTVLETRDDLGGDYRIERTEDGWRQQYHDGESPDSSRTSPTFGGRGISWRAAWSAWGPPNGAEPFREVPADAPLLPAPPAEPGDDDPVGPDASDVRFEDGGGLPPAAELYAPARPATTPSRLEIKRTGRWYDENLITSTNTTSTGGTGMSIGDARQGMLGPIEKLNEALGAIQSGRAALEEAQAGLLQATEGSNQAEADQAHAQVAESLNKVDDAQQQIASALQEFEGVAQRL